MKPTFLKSLLILLLLWMPFKGIAQDAQFTQFFVTPLYLNPAYAGTTPQQRFTLQARLQWPNLPNPFNSYLVSYDFSYPALNSGFGAMIYTDQAGGLGFRQTVFSVSYSYSITLANKWVIRPGIQFGYGLQNLSLGDFDGDGTGGGPGVDPDASFSSLNDSRGFFDFSAGILVYNKNTWLGAALYHVNQPNVAFNDNNVQDLPYKLHIHGGTKIDLYRGVRRTARIPRLAPGFLYRQQGELNSLDMGLNFEYNPIVIGAWYRGIPIFDNEFDSQDAVSLLLGIRFQKFEANYSYDFPLGSLGVSSGGAHEIGLIYQFTYTKAPRPNRSPIACPSFSQSIIDEFKY